ncbi:hypothetical protein C5167_039438 [Papaver somniferum]|uniref:Uncharacterized protein n=1 Tax=Papaver somniferum TaxID=3469 RepID=A0A4Y7ICA4_PAPSO|nr:hypothetical protein C5167_039438 [Papaver somniferum]
MLILNQQQRRRRRRNLLVFNQQQRREKSSSAVRRITPDEYELLNVRKHVRHSSILYLAAECGALLLGDLMPMYLMHKDGDTMFVDVVVDFLCIMIMTSL